MMSIAEKHPLVKRSYQYRSHGFLGKSVDGATPLQAADLLAWEWGKFFDETLAERKRPMRLSLAHLLDGQLGRYRLQPMYGPRFVRFLDEIRDLGLEELQERQDAMEAAAQVDVQQDIATAADDASDGTLDQPE